MEHTIKGRPIVVTLCGSTRFKDYFAMQGLHEALRGNIVLSIDCDLRSDEEIFKYMSEEELKAVKIRLDVLHFRKIDLSDEIFVLNVGGYIGESTSREIEYAKSTGKAVRYLE